MSIIKHGHQDTRKTVRLQHLQLNPIVKFMSFHNRRDLRDYLALETRDASDIKTRRRLLSAEITPWRNRHLAVFPQLKPFTDALDPEVQPEDEVLLLPSDIPFDQHATLSLTHHTSTEFQLREGEANNAVNLLCSSILHGMVLLDTKNEQSRGVYQNTRATKFINLTKAKKHTAMARYRHSRTKLLALSNHSASVLKDYPELRDSETWAKNAASARKIGDGAKVDSWIWTFGRLRGLNTTEKLAFIAESMLHYIWMSINSF